MNVGNEEGKPEKVGKLRNGNNRKGRTNQKGLCGYDKVI